jgi:uncharacterized membrane protein YdbT with pleckstrin-like domain
MRYIEQILQPGERLVYSTTKHWVIYLPGLALLIIALLLTLSSGGPFLHLLYSLVGLAGAGWLLMKWFERFTTEIDVTDKRVIYKKGFISRETVEMNMDKIVSVDVKQSILGRILDYGTITINGAGDNNLDPLPRIGSPLTFRSHITAR